MKPQSSCKDIHFVIKGEALPDWANCEIRDLVGDGALTVPRLVDILRDAVEDMEDLKELSEDAGPSKQYDWDGVRHDLSVCGET